MLIVFFPVTHPCPLPLQLTLLLLPTGPSSSSLSFFPPMCLTTILMGTRERGQVQKGRHLTCAIAIGETADTNWATMIQTHRLYI